MNLAYPILVLDWDYHTFDVCDDSGDILALYDAPEDAEIVIVEGWLWPGKTIPQTLYKRVKDELFKFQRFTAQSPVTPANLCTKKEYYGYSS